MDSLRFDKPAAWLSGVWAVGNPALRLRPFDRSTLANRPTIRRGWPKKSPQNDFALLARFLPTRFLGLWLILLPCLALAAPLRLVVHDPYLDLHTGPGRGYPIVQSVARDSEIEIEYSSTDWYRVRTEHTTGWVHRQQLQATLAAAGIHEDGRAALMERRIEGRLMAGMNAGALDSDPMIGFWTAYRITSFWAAGAAVAQAAGSYSSTRMYRLEAIARPWPELSYPPHVILGVGYFENRPRQTLVEAGKEEALAFTLGLGASKQLEQRLALHADWRWHHARFDSDNDNFHQFTVGFALLF